MLFYQVEAEIIYFSEPIKNPEESEIKAGESEKNSRRSRMRVFRDSDEWENFKEFSAQYSDELYQKSGSKLYVFTVGIRSVDKIQFGVISLGDFDMLDIKEPVREYISKIDAKLINITTKETTLETMHSMLRISNRNDHIRDDDEILEMIGLDELFNHYNRGFKYKETVLTNRISKKALINNANNILCNETLTPEIERIYQVPSSSAEKGHPVHYLVQTNDLQVRERIINILLSALYANNRIRSRRYCSVSFDSDYEFYAKYDVLYHSCVGSTMVVPYCADNEGDSEYAKPNAEYIENICDSIKKHKNNVLTILCLPRSCEKIKSFFMDHLGAVTLVSLTEDIVFGEEAKRYLRRLAKQKKVTADKSLYKKINDEGKGFLTTELNTAFDEWHSKKLKTKVYPQYAEFEMARSQAARNKPKGSAYSELEKMIGLTEAKAVINQALDFNKAQRLFKEKGMKSVNTAMHMVFTGNPGTAKTTAARLFAQVMKENGLLSEGRLYEVGRADLVGKFVGWTAPIVKSKFKAAKGSVLFIDEAYSLVDDKDGLFGDEAINTIVQEMENNREDMVVIFAGYPDKMEKFLQKNPGLRSRIAFHVPFKDYSPEELYQITELLAANQKITLSEDVEEKLLPVYARHSEHDDFGNGRFARNLLEKAQMKQASRLVTLDPEKVTKDDVLTLTAEDFEAPEMPKTQKNTIGFA